MANVQLLRNARLWVSTALDPADIAPENTKEILLQDDFSFSQTTSSSDVSLDEAGPKPSRGSKRFNDALEAVDWSFSTYLRALSDGDEVTPLVTTPDAILWHALSSAEEFNPTEAGNGVESQETQLRIDFLQNQSHTLTPVVLYILMEGVWYKINEGQVGQAEISVDISGIGSVNWSGNGTTLETLGAEPFDPESAEYKFSDEDHIAATYIKNKLTVLKVTDNNDNVEYNIPITGGSITINNNITYLTPNTLSRVDTSIGSFTGSMEVTGSLEAYLRFGGLGDEHVGDLLQKMQADRSVTNSFTIALCMGGIRDKVTVDNTNEKVALKNPGVVVVLKSAHLGIPSVESADVIGTTIEFKAVPTDFSVSDEIIIGMSNDYNKTNIDALIASA